ncbi:SWIM zinc finger family protein [Bradyrhizobium sp. PMVTL-01]|uniref:SWIM zinc finger family protein n=1 Tax=Bradyrhizobium sp. PMVTL-01 TaxID=3434999 RepID=UPI003F6FB525
MILYEIQTGITVENGRILKIPEGWLIGPDNLVKRDRYAEWSCSCTKFANLGLCSHVVAVAATEDERIKAIGEQFMRDWLALATVAVRMKAALAGNQAPVRSNSADSIGSD